MARQKLQEMIQERPKTTDEASKVLFKVFNGLNPVQREGGQEEEPESEVDSLVTTVTEDFEEDKNTKKTIKAGSPFTAHFLEIQLKVQSQIPAGGNRVNSLVHPAFITFLQEEFMPYIFLWGSFCLK
jgi:hypothetical protein